MRHVLERGFAVGHEEVDPSRTKFGARDRSKLTRHPKGAHRDRFIEVCHEHRVLARYHEHVTVRDGLHVHEGDHGVVLVREARRLVATQDLAEHTAIAHLGSAKLKGD